MCGPSCGHVQTVSVTCAVPLMDSFLLLSPPLFSSPYHTPDAVSTCWHTFLLFSTLFITPPSSSACKLTALPASFHSHTYLHRDSCFMSFVSLSITIATRRGPGLIPDAVIPLSHSSHACPGTPQPTPDFLIQDGIFWNNLATTSAATSPLTPPTKLCIFLLCNGCLLYSGCYPGRISQLPLRHTWLGRPWSPAHGRPSVTIAESFIGLLLR